MKTVQLVDVRLASTITRSTGGTLTGKPVCEWAPGMHLIEDLKSEKDRRHLSQAIVELYELSHFEVKSNANLLQNVLASFPSPLVTEKTKGVKEACSTSLSLLQLQLSVQPWLVVQIIA